MSLIVQNLTENDIPVRSWVVPGSGELVVDPANYHEFAESDEFWQLVVAGSLLVKDSIKTLGLADAIDFLKNYQQKSPVTEDGRFLNAPNRIPAGYSLYVAGKADNISGAVYGGGTSLKFDYQNLTRDFQLLSHYYVIGARGIWQGADLDNEFSASLIGPATQGLAVQTGDYNLSGPMIVPVAAGTGNRSLNLTAKIGSSQVLACTPIPSTGNQGWFDYNPTTNVVTRNMEQKGGYNLYNVDVNIHAFARGIWGRASNGAESRLDITELVGKLIFNFWKIRFVYTLNGSILNTTQKAGIYLILGSKQNI